jgi:Aldo/keto reductase family
MDHYAQYMIWQKRARFVLCQSTDAFFIKYIGTQTAAELAINKAVEEIAKKRGISMAQVALAWSLSNSFVSAPIVGTTSLANLQDVIGAVCVTRGCGIFYPRIYELTVARRTEGAHVNLTPEEIKSIEEPYQP